MLGSHPIPSLAFEGLDCIVCLYVHDTSRGVLALCPLLICRTLLPCQSSQRIHSHLAACWFLRGIAACMSPGSGCECRTFRVCTSTSLPESVCPRETLALRC
ncbi:hypothetical protein PV10_04465 [Exophiala mesophila]|uniref:Uncharacterized protein n=1 Tax=Exophiala mesophila TaxID=212818 RepID=A0A0D1XYB5_EXOME|nr:uncharacterized protein PV10_04465 [Exophiala mesophila]KIV93236.1 hypothetical protein PV10_04465 [Exophiala mesophila]